MITIRKAKLRDYAILMELSVNDEQKCFVSDFGDLYNKRTHDHDFYVINEGKELLGFFMIDRAYPKMYTFAGQNEIGLRNLLIDKKYQGNGYAVIALKKFLDYVYGAYPDADSICLTVNKKNIGAYKCYENAGFVDSSELYYGGEAGPQHILRKKIG